MKKQMISLCVLAMSMTLCFVFMTNIRPCAAGDYPGKWYGWYFPVKLKGLNGQGAYTSVGWAHENQKILNSWGYKAKNVDEIKDLLPTMYYEMIKNPKVWGGIRINETAYMPRTGVLAERHRAATEKYKGQSYIDKDGELRNYKAGIPFPDSEDALEWAWNFQKRSMFCDAMKGAAISINNNAKGQARGTSLEMNQFNFDRRLFGEQAPLYEPNPDEIEFLYTMGWKYPYGVRGIVVKVVRYLGPQADDMWMYLPSIRRVRRMSTSQRWDRTPGGSVAMWETIQGFYGKIKNYDWKYLGKRELLVGHNSSAQCQKMKAAPGAVPDQLYQRVKTVELEYIPKPHMHAPASRVIMHFDPESCSIYYASVYDKKGKLWLLYITTYAHANNGVKVESNYASIDYQRIQSNTGYNCVPEYNEEATDVVPQAFEMERLKKYFAAR